MEKEKLAKSYSSDIDGTLLTSDGQITEGTKEMILNLEKKGIPFILDFRAVTGRRAGH